LASTIIYGIIVIVKEVMRMSSENPKEKDLSESEKKKPSLVSIIDPESPVPRLPGSIDENTIDSIPCGIVE